jgi:hypothetical protein
MLLQRLHKIMTTIALAAWSNGNVSSCEGMGREVESRQGTWWKLFNIENIEIITMMINH